MRILSPIIKSKDDLKKYLISLGRKQMQDLLIFSVVLSKMIRKYIWNYFNELKIAKYTCLYIDECHFYSSSLPIYIWSKKGEIPNIVIRQIRGTTL